MELENIEARRRSQGIEDVELRLAIRALGVGDFVRVTLVASPLSMETLRVRITSIRGSAFRGKLARKPAVPGLSQVPGGAAVAFTTAHIHSVERSASMSRVSDSIVVIHPPSRIHPPARHTGRAKTKPRSRAALLRPLAATPPWTTAERLQCIAALGQRIQDYVQFMCQAGNPNSTSAEVTEKAVLAFYEQLSLLETRLGRIHDDFQLE